METQKVRIAFLIQFEALSPVIDERVLVEEEIESIIQTICYAAEGIQNIQISLKKLKRKGKKGPLKKG